MLNPPNAILLEDLSHIWQHYEERANQIKWVTFFFVGYLLTMFSDCIIMFVTKGVNESSESKVEVDEEGRSTNIDEGHGTNPFLKTTSLGDTILLILALCFHSIFEGIAVGVSGK